MNFKHENKNRRKRCARSLPKPKATLRFENWKLKTRLIDHKYDDGLSVIIRHTLLALIRTSDLV